MKYENTQISCLPGHKASLSMSPTDSRSVQNAYLCPRTFLHCSSFSFSQDLKRKRKQKGEINVKSTELELLRAGGAEVGKLSGKEKQNLARFLRCQKILGQLCLAMGRFCND